ncbi:probable tRNA (uracil-O(2)-)-methyltransferase [Teleopsis dalmanni]|uniref:probable tRNA (uracil-O(2)-)-methyltransferase n=1 Tax=Teleopsis dalmanni TaxID=139649 RepID=UPI0018CFE6CA|nr:probable tRNA (uracil-O(2)-)-methyltransferase [Teleopsis dalmanni]
MAELTEAQFWRCIFILIRNYHAVNKKIFSCVITCVKKIINENNQIQTTNVTNVSKQNDERTVCDSTIEELEKYLDNSSSSQRRDKCIGFIINYKLLTKKLGDNITAIGKIDFVKIRYTCNMSGNIFEDFVVSYVNSDIVIEMLTQHLDINRTERWMTQVLKPKLLKWCQKSKADNSSNIRSLQMIDNEYYNDLYKTLKIKYAEKVIKFWDDAKESTDPLKFIYEDLAIAAYLITYWQTNNAEAETVFADLGCGNGLLVYILNEEGYDGFGYDIRSRKLWSLYPSTTKLIEQAIHPDDFNLPVGVNWVIGNHSDELSPWLPVLAAIGSYNMNYFLLPCCAYEFSGEKYQRRNSNISVYQDFMNYVRDISQKSGFITIQDRLKIPSTKRLVLMGTERIYSVDQYDRKVKELLEFVAIERNLHSIGNRDDEIKLREKSIAVRNCTKIDRCIIDDLVKKIFLLLLEINNNNLNKDISLIWHHGGQLTMRALAEKLTKEDLKRIKSECGGIKTLLRNKHEIFEFRGNDLIGIRKPQVLQKVPNKQQTYKKRLCFFKTNHPQGCPLNDNDCTFLH